MKRQAEDEIDVELRRIFGPKKLGIYIPNPPVWRHLIKVIRQMRSRNDQAPTIRAFKYDGMWYAIEGSHRLCAAKALDLMPRIVDVTNATHKTLKLRKTGFQTLDGRPDLHPGWLFKDLLDEFTQDLGPYLTFTRQS